MPVKLKQFTDRELVINQAEAASILEFFFGGPPLSPNAVTNDDRKFAQALIVEAINASFQMGFVAALFKSTAKVPSGPKAVIKKFLSESAKHLWKYRSREDLQEMMKEPVIYESVRATLARSFRMAWSVRIQTGSLMY